MFGQRLRMLRKEHKVTQAQLASFLNLDASTISKYEKADVTPSTDILLKIAQFFDVPTDFLLGSDTKKSPATEVASDEEVEALRNLVRQLTPEQQAELLRYGQYLASQKPDSSKR